MKIRAIFILVALFAILASIVPPVHAGSGNSPAGLAAAGWECVQREGKYVFCMVPHWKTPPKLPASIINKVFETQDLTSTDAPFVGTTVYLREDLYAGQPCPSSDLTVWEFVPFGGGLYPYYYCRHPVQ